MGEQVSRIFLSHSSRNAREAVALKRWLSAQDRMLEAEIFLDIDPDTGIPTGALWRQALQSANSRCEAVICLLSADWAASAECRLEYDTAVALNKRIFCARLETSSADELTAQFQRCDLFGESELTAVDMPDGGEAVHFASDGLYRLFNGIKGAGIAAESFHWPPESDPGRAPYRGWEPLTEADAAVFFGRDSELVQGLDALRGMRKEENPRSLFVVLGPSGAGKSSFLRAGILPRLRRDDRNFTVLDIVRPGRAVLSGKSGLAMSIHQTRLRLGISTPTVEAIAVDCMTDINRVRELLSECRTAAERRLLKRESGFAPTTLVLPVDQAEELFTADAGPEAAQFQAIVSMLAAPADGIKLIVAATIRTDRYEAMQTAPALAGLQTLLFDNLKPMPPNRFKEVIEGPAKRATEGGQRLEIDPALVARLLSDATEGADTLPMLSLTLAWLFAHHGHSGRLSLQHYIGMGGMDRVLQNEIDASLSPDPLRRGYELAQLRAAFIPWLATINPDNDQPMRRIARYRDLPEPSRPLIDRLVERRLMVSDRRNQSELTVEVALESLLRKWDDLAGWLRDQRHDLKAADDLERAAAGWRAAGKDEGWLLAGARLSDAEALAATSGFRQRLSDVHEFLWSCRDAENRRQLADEQRRQAEVNAAREKQATAEAHALTLHKRQQVLRRVLVATALVAIIAVIGGTVAVISFRQAALARDEAQASLRQATVAKLKSEARAALGGSADGSDIGTYDKLLVAYRIESTDSESPDTSAILEGLTATPSTVKIISTPDTDRMFALSPVGRTLVRGANDFSVRRYDAVTGDLIGVPLEGHADFVFSVAFSPDGKLIASASGDRTVRIWDTQTGNVVRVLQGQHSDAILRVRFSPDGRTVATGGRDQVAVLWDVASGQPIGRPMALHQDRILDLAFSPDGRLLATASYDGTARLWDAVTAIPVGEPFHGEQGGLASVAFSPDGNRLAAGGADLDGLWIWGIADHKAIAKAVPGQGNTITDIQYSADGARMVSTSLDGTIVQRDVDTGEAMCQPLTGHAGRVYNAAFETEGYTLMTAGEDATVREWDLRNSCLVGTRDVWSVAFTAGAPTIFTGHDDGTMRLWDRETGAQIGTFIGHTGPVFRIVPSRDGTRVLSLGDDGTVRLWDVMTQKQVGQPLQDIDSTKAVAISPDADRLITAGNDVLTVWDGRSGTPLHRAPIESLDITAVVFSSDGKRFATGATDNSVRVWDTETVKPIAKPFTEHSEIVWSLAFSPDGKTLASAAMDKTIWLYDLETMEPLGSLTGHGDTVIALAFSGDGQLLASGGNDSDVRLWNVARQQQIGAPLHGHTKAVLGIAFDTKLPNMLLTGAGDGAIRRWPTSGDPAALCTRLTSNVNQREWDTLASSEIPYQKICDDLPIRDP